MNKPMHKEDLYMHRIEIKTTRNNIFFIEFRQLVDMSSSFSLGKPFDTPSLPSPMLNPSNTHLDDAHQQFCKKMVQLADMNVYSICNECYPGIPMKKFHGAYGFSRCIL